MTRKFLCLIFLVAAVTASPTLAKTPKILDWTDLVPNQEPVKDPLAALPPERMNDFANLKLAKDMIASGLTGQDLRVMNEEIQELERKLRKQGVNLEQLLSEYTAFEDEVTKRGKALVDSVNGSKVKIGGYLLPLELSEKGSQEFLLVPYVGACIHVPPPPPNQIVYVHMENPYQVRDLFTPVQITGEMSTKRSSKNLSLVDGSAPIDVGYSMLGQAVETYQQ